MNDLWKKTRFEPLSKMLINRKKQAMEIRRENIKKYLIAKIIELNRQNVDVSFSSVHKRKDKEVEKLITMSKTVFGEDGWRKAHNEAGVDYKIKDNTEKNTLSKMNPEISGQRRKLFAFYKKR